MAGGGGGGVLALTHSLCVGKNILCISTGCFPQATFKKKFVSCPAGGRIYGHSGGRKLLLFFFCV